MHIAIADCPFCDYEVRLTDSQIDQLDHCEHFCWATVWTIEGKSNRNSDSHDTTSRFVGDAEQGPGGDLLHEIEYDVLSGGVDVQWPAGVTRLDIAAADDGPYESVSGLILFAADRDAFWQTTISGFVLAILDEWLTRFPHRLSEYSAAVELIQQGAFRRDEPIVPEG